MEDADYYDQLNRISTSTEGHAEHEELEQDHRNIENEEQEEADYHFENSELDDVEKEQEDYYHGEDVEGQGMTASTPFEDSSEVTVPSTLSAGRG